MFRKCKCGEEIKELIKELKRFTDERIFMDKLLNEALQLVRDNDKKTFAWKIQKEDEELIKDGLKYRSIIKIIK